MIAGGKDVVEDAVGQIGLAVRGDDIKAVFREIEQEVVPLADDLIVETLGNIFCLFRIEIRLQICLHEILCVLEKDRVLFCVERHGIFVVREGEGAIADIGTADLLCEQLIAEVFGADVGNIRQVPAKQTGERDGLFFIKESGFDLLFDIAVIVVRGAGGKERRA